MPHDLILTPHEVVVTCLHCDKQVVITIPRGYIEADALVRGLTSRPMPQ